MSLQFLAYSTKNWALTIPHDANPLLLWEHRIYLPIVCQTYFSEAMEGRVKTFLAEFGLKLHHEKLTFFNGWQQNPQAIWNLMGSSEQEYWWQSGHLYKFAVLNRWHLSLMTVLHLLMTWLTAVCPLVALLYEMVVPGNYSGPQETQVLWNNGLVFGVLHFSFLSTSFPRHKIKVVDSISLFPRSTLIW